LRHAQRVAYLSQKWAIDLGMSTDRIVICFVAGMWHDAVYKVGELDNEELSAQALLELHPYMKVAADIIRKTTLMDHLSTNITSDNDPLASIVLDADLSSLAEDYDSFLQHQLNIAMEHGLTEITTQHCKFLTQFLMKENIYRSPAGAHLEGFARQNIERLNGEFGNEK
jgi:predicted metal-dependent HD superfamily phosphohydrolase